MHTEVRDASEPRRGSWRGPFEGTRPNKTRSRHRAQWEVWGGWASRKLWTMPACVGESDLKAGRATALRETGRDSRHARPPFSRSSAGFPQFGEAPEGAGAWRRLSPRPSQGCLCDPGPGGTRLGSDGPHSSPPGMLGRTSSSRAAPCLGAISEHTNTQLINSSVQDNYFPSPILGWDTVRFWDTGVNKTDMFPVLVDPTI